MCFSARSESTDAAITRLVDSWTAALAGTSDILMSTVEIGQFLCRLARRLADAVLTDPFHSQPAQDVGAALVEAHFVGTDALGRSIRVIGSHLLDVCDQAVPDRTDARERLAAIQEAMAAGYMRALRERTLDEQEAIRKVDIDARGQIAEALRASEARFRTVFTQAAIGIGLADMDGHMVQANETLASMLGYSVAEFCQLMVADLLPAEDAPSMGDAYRNLIHGDVDRVCLEKRYRHRDGGIVWTNHTASVIRDHDGAPQYTLALVEDISERRLLQDKLRHQALHDPLTQLPNRALFFQRLDSVFSDAEARIGLCFLGLDGFKVVNDTLGHHIGDELLIAVAARLDAGVSRTDRLVARMGGDEFMILVEHSTGTCEVTELAAAALAALDAPFEIAGHQLSVSASVGVVERPVAGTTPSQVMKAVDIMLDRAKSDGKGQYAVFDPERDARAITRMTLSATMRAALGRGEFTIEYQPLVDLADGALRGVEALLRWRHPTLGTLAPDQFIDIAEETGFIVPLGRWVLEQACLQAREWHDLFPDAGLFVSVNLAVRQACDADVVDDVTRILDKTGLAVGLLQLELTESALMGSSGRGLDALRTLSAMGVHIAIDDFGTGYSNFAYLRRLPVHTLKLAGPFVRGFGRSDRPNPIDEPIVETLVSLAHTLGLTVTAECVETEQQAQQLRALGCDTAQGWYFAHPATPEVITGLLRAAASNAAAAPGC